MTSGNHQVRLLHGEFAASNASASAEPWASSDHIGNRVMVGKFADDDSVVTWLVTVWFNLSFLYCLRLCLA